MYCYMAPKGEQPGDFTCIVRGAGVLRLVLSFHQPLKTEQFCKGIQRWVRRYRGWNLGDLQGAEPWLLTELFAQDIRGHLWRTCNCLISWQFSVSAGNSNTWEAAFPRRLPCAVGLLVGWGWSICWEDLPVSDSPLPAAAVLFQAVRIHVLTPRMGWWE